MIRRSASFFAVAVLLIGLSACQRPEPPQKTTDSGPSVEITSTNAVQEISSRFDDKLLINVGKSAYMTSGQLTCLYCHGDRGQGGGYPGSSSLKTPWEWRSFQALGGYEALKADPEKFRRDLETVLTNLIHDGAIKWNTSFRASHPEIRLADNPAPLQFNTMMWGLEQMKHAIPRAAKNAEALGTPVSEGQASWLAAYAALRYIQTLEEANPAQPGAKVWEAR